MKTYYVGVLVFSPDDIRSTEVFDNLEDCEIRCLEDTEDYYVVSFDIQINDSNTVH